MTRALLLVAVCLVGTSALVGGCKPKPGGACKGERRETCVSETQALACHGGTWEEMPCRGPAGCAKSGAESTCDQSVVADKDVCNLDRDFVCASDKKGMLECTKGRWTFAQSCLGDRGCTTDERKVTCDNSVATLGEGCREEDDHACAADRKTALVCRAGKFVLASNCRGKSGCRVTSDKQGFKIECDDTIAQAGDACDKEGHFACAPDERSIVKCVGKRFVADEKCTKKNERCAVKGDLVGCY
jgi:hypothetical protein